MFEGSDRIKHESSRASRMFPGLPMDEVPYRVREPKGRFPLGPVAAMTFRWERLANELGNRGRCVSVMSFLVAVAFPIPANSFK